MFIELPGMKHISSVVVDTKKDIDAYSKGKKQLIKIFSDKFNEAIGGIRLGEQMTIAARPGVGKSSIANLLILSMLEKNPNLKLLFFYWTLEMSVQEQVLRLMSYYIKTKTATQILTKTKTDQERNEINKAGDILSTYPIYMRDIRTSVDTCSKIWDYVSNSQYSDYHIVNIFDHTRLISGNETREIERITNLMAIGNEYKNIMGNTNIYLSQLNRNVEAASGSDRQNKGTDLPELSDIFGSDAVGQFSTMVLLLHNPSNYGLTSFKLPNGTIINDTRDLVIGKIGKNRNGKMGILLWYEDFAHGQLYDSREELMKNQID